MSEHDLTREKIQACLPNLNTLTELFVKKFPNNNEMRPRWVVEAYTGGNHGLIEVTIKLVTNTGTYTKVLDQGTIEVSTYAFMQQDTPSAVIRYFLDNFTEMANNIEFRYRAIWRAREIFS